MSMADTRCANPEYQLDVDLMILEYLLYHAIQAELDVSKCGPSLDRVTEIDDAEIFAKQETSNRLLGMFNAFINTFNQVHPSHEIDVGVQFNIKILEFILLLSRRRRSAKPMSDVNGIQQSRFTMSMQSKLAEESMKNFTARCLWLSLYDQTQSQHTESHVESQISNTWQEYQQSLENSQTTSRPKDESVILFDLLPRFMELSAEIATILGEVTETWMQLAGNFMLQTALEMVNNPSRDSSFQPHLGHCFAWGFVDRTDEDPNDFEDDINAMFEPPAVAQAWSRIRFNNLNEFLIPERIGEQTREQACQRRLARLRLRHPAREFEASLWEYIEGLFILNVKEGLNGKPILLQLEEGHLSSLGIEKGSEEFEDFCRRVGIKLDFTENDTNGDVNMSL